MAKRPAPDRLLEPSALGPNGSQADGNRGSYRDPAPVRVPATFKYDAHKSFERNQPAWQTLRATDQETARVVAIHRSDGKIVGAGCLIDHLHILTCRHVVSAALGGDRRAAKTIVGKSIYASLPGVSSQPTVWAEVAQAGEGGPIDDLALLRIPSQPGAQIGIIAPVEFASPLRHAGKSYSVLGFPDGDQQGRNAIGRLHAADAKGLVQMDRGGALSVLGGFSGAPVWCSDLSAFVGLVVTDLAGDYVSCCIPSRRLCELYPQLRVRFRIPPSDRPVIHDREVDDPNTQLFGHLDDNGQRRLHAVVRERSDRYTVNLYYDCKAEHPPRGHFVTFITYPDFEEEDEDAYELFAEIAPNASKTGWRATQTCYPSDLFTVAAIGDGGDTVLTLDLEDVPRTPA
jgi:hypothetical protein